MTGPLTIPIPLGGGVHITVEGVWPVSEAQWAQFLVVLDAMKPGLVRDPEPVLAERGELGGRGFPDMRPAEAGARAV